MNRVKIPNANLLKDYSVEASKIRRLHVALV